MKKSLVALVALLASSSQLCMAAITITTKSDLNIALLSESIVVTWNDLAGWDKSMDFKNSQNWDQYNHQWAQRIKSPLSVTISGSK